MQKYRDIFGQIVRLAVVLLVCVAVMLAVYGLLGFFSIKVLLGAVIGYLLAMGNFISLSITVSNALDRAARDQEPQRAQLAIQSSSVIRLLVLAGIYILLFRTRVCDPLAALLPLLLAQAALKLVEFFRKDDKGGDAAL